MSFDFERELLSKKIIDIYNKNTRQGISNIIQKSTFDLVTDIDFNIEKDLSKVILENFPNDLIHGEETTHKELTDKRTWTIDPIDGTCNMANTIPVYGVQLALFEKNEPVLSMIYLPNFNMFMYAVKGEGSYLNGVKVNVKQNNPLNNAMISFGDYTHKSVLLADLQHKAIGYLYPRIAKIRMFGAACVDFLCCASGKTDGTVVITKNLWDLAPGILICKEAGAIITNLTGEPYHFGDEGAVASCNMEIAQLLNNAFNR